MNRAAALLLAIAFVSFALARYAHAQALISIDSSAPLNQGFDGIGSDVPSQLPTGWVVSSGTAFDLGRSHVEKSAGTSGLSQVLTTNSPGGFYNFADGDGLASTDRSVGFLSDFSSPQQKSLFVGLQNNTGSTITELHLSFDIEKYRSGTRANDITLFYGFDGANWNEIPDGNQHYDADSSTAVVNPPTTISKSIALSGLSISNQTNLFFRWFYFAGTASNCQALGIDNFQLIPGPLQQPDLQWDGAPGATWDAASTNWKSSSGGHVLWNDNVPNNATFADGGAGIGTVVTLSSPRHAGRLTFNAGSKTYTLSGSSLQLSGAGGIGILASSNAVIQAALQITSSQTWDISSIVSISGALAFSSNVTLSKKGSGSLVLSGPQIAGSDFSIKVSDGTLRLAANLGNSARLNLQGNSNSTDATIVIEADQDLAELTISTADPGNQGLNLSSPTAPGAFRSLRIHAADLVATKATLYDLIRQARLTPDDGIYDSALLSHPNSALGLAATANDYILIRPTRIGDLNLDGQVTISDFIDLSSNFGRSNVTWQEGDLNADGAVTIADFIDLASNFGATYAGQTLPISESDQQALSSFATTHGAAVPEPVSISLLLLASLATLRPRRLQFAK